MLEKLIQDALQGMLGGGQQPQAQPQGGGGLGGGLGGALGGLGGGALIQILASLLNKGGAGGGLGGLVEQFRRAGMGQQADSWVSTGQNMPVSLDQLIQVFGRNKMQEMAQQAGMPTEQFGGQMAEILPQMIDKLTPQGQVPSGGIEDAIGMLAKILGK